MSSTESQPAAHSPLRPPRSPGRVAIMVVAALLLFVSPASGALTLQELREKKLSPKQFAACFTDFSYVFHEEIQPPEVFLATRAGDCDDYASLADGVLTGHGYTTRLIAVRMPGLLTHVVCYVHDDRIYLDYNNRGYLLKTQKSGASLREIAAKVAKSFDANWTSASEFTYRDGIKRLVQTVAKVAEGTEPAPQKPRIQIDF